MENALFWHRLQFAFTITYHYLFPQLTMGLALILLIWKYLALHTGDDLYNRGVRFWSRIFGLNIQRVRKVSQQKSTTHLFLRRI